jgi:hypothetical protein
MQFVLAGLSGGRLHPDGGNLHRPRAGELGAALPAWPIKIVGRTPWSARVPLDPLFARQINLIQCQVDISLNLASKASLQSREIGGTSDFSAVGE